MGKWLRETRLTTQEARAYLHSVSTRSLIEWERTYVRRMVEIAAADGDYVVHIDALWQVNVQWLRDEGFLVLGDDDRGYDISWGRSYKW